MEDADGYKVKHGMPSNQGLVDICKTFLLGIEDAGYYASLYASLSWLNNQLNSSELDRFDKWVAQWNTSCTYKRPYGIWQYTDSGKVNGINGNVDMNIAYINYPEVIKKSALNGFTAGTDKEYQTYTIKKGDTLWDISKKYLGTGTRYPEIMSLNALKSTTIYPGQILRIPN